MSRRSNVYARPCGHRHRTAGRRRCFALFALILAEPVVSTAHASSEAAWESFRADVENRCTAAAQPHLSDIRVRVDPFGSADYGLALIDGVAERAERRSQLICVYDKHDASVQLGTALGPVEAEDSAP
ncbi:hypothetical protein [Salinisphaera sp. T31B1]|uniref:hypothetical protein n=1 Tax=Salinisphaera sp. T31B1 TaxID=727963 RepID=UPI0033428F5B